MSDKKNIKEQEQSAQIKPQEAPAVKYFTLKLFITVVAAFAAALVFRRSAGILAMTPLVFVICFASAFIDINRYIKAVIFGLTVFCVNKIEAERIETALIFSALCILAVILFDVAINVFKKKKVVGVSVATVGLAACILLSGFFVGNPFKALTAKDMFENYTNSVYPSSESAALGDFEFSKVYYRYDTKAYVTDAVASRYPTEGATITTGGDVIRDGFKPIMESKLSEAYILELTSVLRQAFPDGSFTVEFDDIAVMPEKSIFSASEGELSGNMQYIITLGGIQTATAMYDRVEDYMKAIDDSGIEYGRIIFKSGVGIYYRRCIIIEGGHFKYHAALEAKRIHAGTNTAFMDMISQMIKIEQ